MFCVQSRLSELEKQMVELIAAREELQGKCLQFSCACMCVCVCVCVCVDVGI